MSWKWEEMTEPAFEKAVKAAKGVCIVPLGAIEKHGEHLPLGADLFQVRSIAERVVNMEPAVLFPSYYLTEAQEARHARGAIAIRTDLVIELMDNICDEISRNGLHKILLLNGNGSNESWLPSFAMRMLERERGYTLYVARLRDYWTPATEDPEWKKMMVSAQDQHAGEVETSVMLAVRPDLVKMKVLRGSGGGQKRMAPMPSLLTPVSWYAETPELYYGDAMPATRDKGQFLLERMLQRAVAIVKAVKEDDKTAELEKEYFSKLQH